MARFTTRLLLAATTAAAIGFSPALAQEDIDTISTSGVELRAVLSGAAVPGMGDPDGAGRFVLHADPVHGMICYEMYVTNIELPTAASLHAGRTGETGPRIVPLEPPAGGDASACTALPAGWAAAIIREPSGFYVDVSNHDYPDGALRGQLRVPGTGG
jgi:hypothetical protein